MFYVVMLLLFVQQACFSAAIFLSAPFPIAEAEILAGAKDRTLCMHWSMDNQGYFEFETSEDKVFFEIVFTTFPAGFTEQEKALFHEEKKGFVFSCGTHFETPSIPSSSYTVFERRVFTDASPKAMTLQQLSDLCQEKKVIFYTGAGISASAQVPLMKELEEDLHLTKGGSSLQKIVQDPERAASIMRKFHASCIHSPPTPAHIALAKLAQLRQTQVLTENVDYLHEWTGIKPYRIIAGELDLAWVAEIDAIICVGLSIDDKGFLGWYKHHHPQGKIIAIDLKQPAYLGDEDYFLQGDLQEIIPALYLPKKI